MVAGAEIEIPNLADFVAGIGWLVSAVRFEQAQGLVVIEGQAADAGPAEHVGLGRAEGDKGLARARLDRQRPRDLAGLAE